MPGTAPDLARDESAIDHSWGEGSPGASILPDRFIARWTRTIKPAPGDYEFAVTADDGVRLYVDGVRVIDKWIDQGPTTYRTTVPLDGGLHKIVMEYYENGGGATARLSYTEVGGRSRAHLVPGTVLEHTGRDRRAHYSDSSGRPRALRRHARVRLGRGLARNRDRGGNVRGALDEDRGVLGRRLPVHRCP